MTFKIVAGWTLSILTVISALLCIAGIWGWIKGDTVGQLLGTFMVIGGCTIGLSYVMKSFFSSERKQDA
jgi:hypothetical protein